MSAPLPRGVTLVLAPNPGPMTLEGTNTWVIAGPSANVVVDPGPDDAGHLAAVAALGRVGLIVLTHGHLDHAEGAQRLAAATGAPVTAFDPGLCVGTDPLAEGACGEAGTVTLRVLATPGHTCDSVTLLVEGSEPALLTGDTVLGRGTTVVAHPDGRLADYLASLERLRALARDHPGLILLPGHGPPGALAEPVLERYLAHRRERLDQVRAALAAGAETPGDVVRRVYPSVDRSLWPAAEQSVRAQLDYLRQCG